MKHIVLIILMALVFSPFGFSQDKDKTIKYHAFSNTLLLGVDAGVSLGFTDYSDIRPDVVGRAFLEYFFPSRSQGTFGLRGFAMAGYVGGKDVDKIPTVFRTTVTRFGAGVTYNLSIADAVFPYAFAGADYGWFTPNDENKNQLRTAGEYDAMDFNYLGEVGVRFLVAKSMALNISATGHFTPEDFLDDVVRNGDNDMYVTFQAGFTYSLFSNIDSDGDGVPDSKDQCPNTPMGVSVDDFGCPLDDDKDGVPDYLDKCPKTPIGLQVDEFGCPIDSDGDGVPDKNDRCPNTPKGAKVNEYGCPDSDNDGVPDDLDKCPDTPAGAPVDERGCPKDSDGDGVPDYLDKCPNTAAGQEVDEFGCDTKVDTVVQKITLSGDTNFEFNKSNLLPSAYTVLDPLAESMKKNPKIRWRIEGHTDAIGSDSYNMKLSRERAQSVANYLISKGVDSGTLDIVPLGESQPVSDNSSPEGRAMNRRVEINALNP